MFQVTNEELQDACLKYLINEFSCCEKTIDKFLTSYKIAIPQLIEDKKKFLCIKEVGISDFQENVMALGNSDIPTSGTLKSRFLEVGKTDSNDTDSNDKNFEMTTLFLTKFIRTNLCTRVLVRLPLTMSLQGYGFLGRCNLNQNHAAVPELS